MAGLQRLMDILTVLGAVVAAALVLGALLDDGVSAPQQGALAAMAAAIVIIPYCLSAIAHRAHVREQMPKGNSEAPPV